MAMQQPIVRGQRERPPCGHRKRCPFPLLSSGGSADIPPVAKFVAVVICVGLGLSPSAFATTGTGALLRSAAQLSGLTVRRPVPSATVSGRRYDSLLARAIER